MVAGSWRTRVTRVSAARGAITVATSSGSAGSVAREAPSDKAASVAVAAAGGVARQQPVDELDGLRRRVGRRGRRARVPPRGRGGAPSRAGPRPRTAGGRSSSPEEDAAERVEVRRGPGRLPGGLLRRPVLGRPGEHAGDGRAARRAREPREAEVGDDDAAAAALDEDVRGRQVAMDDAARVRVRERRRDGGAERRASSQVCGPPARRVSSAIALDELHDQHRLAVGPRGRRRGARRSGARAAPAPRPRARTARAAPRRRRPTGGAP